MTELHDDNDEDGGGFDVDGCSWLKPFAGRIATWMTCGRVSLPG